MAPSDFFLFGWLKGEVARRRLVEMEDVLQGVSPSLGNRTIDIIRSAFLDWIERLKQVLYTSNHYI
jgi:hypothetical protein